MSQASNSTPSTPDATAGVAQSKDRQTGTAQRRVSSYADEDRPFDISPSLSRHVQARPYQRRSDDPVYRPLRIFALDPGVSKLEGAVALVNVPYEPLDPGPRGRLFHVKEVEQPKTAGNVEEPECSEWAKRDSVCDLEDHRVLLTQGYAPARSDPRFQNQMIYAVCSSVYAAFKAALGRDPVWGFAREDDEENDPGALTLFPRAFEKRNAHYDKSDGSLNFGYFAAKDTANGFMRGERVFTCLSHDVVVHELTHALLDGMRAHFTIPTQIDVLAFHEAFADLVTVFQHFSYREVVLAAIKKSGGEVTGALLTDLARPLAESAGMSADRPSALRRAIDDPRQPPEKRLRYNQKLEVHELGSVLVLAVFDAFNTVYRRKVERYIRLASGGLGRLGQFPADLQAILAEEASQLASQFLSICIRAIDYCPPVDLEFGDFLRAVITADRELVPDDRWGYREAWIDAFRERGILPLNVEALDEEALSWKAPKEKLNPVKKLSFYWLRFRGDPGRPADENELGRQALALGAVIADPKYTKAFGLRTPQAGSIHKPCIESIRSARRIGPDGQIVFDIVAEISQRRIVSGKNGRGLVFYGGSTIVLGPEGEIRYVIGKGVKSDKRAEIQFDFMQSDRGMRYWELRNNLLEPKENVLKNLHQLEPVESYFKSGEGSHARHGVAT